MPNSNPKDWSVADLVDLEYFLAADAEADPASLSHRDRELYRAHLAEETPPSRRALLRRWLELRRDSARAEQAAPLPGDVVAALLRPFTLLLLAVGGLGGAALAWGVLSYAGTRPINLFAALALLVAVPFFFALLSAGLPALRLALRGNPAGVFGGWLTGALLTRLSRRAYALLGERDSGRTPSALAQSWGVLRGRGGLYAGIMGWLAFALMQVAALGFSLGVLLTVMVRGWFADLAFSWQTTTQLSAEGLHALVSVLARPWATLAEPPFSHPTLEQVAGSRVFLKEGLQHLASGDLQSWWYFLLWAILCYTVLPRLLLLGTAFFGIRRALSRLSFPDARCEALMRRMQHPQVRIGRDGEVGEDEAAASLVLPAEMQAGMTRLRALVPTELLARPVADGATAEIAKEFGAAVETLAPVALDENTDTEVLRGLGADSASSAVLLVLEGWQPCITATLEYLKTLRRALGRERLLVVGLIGRETPGRWGTPTPDHEFDIWRQRLAALGDPCLLVHNWGRSTDE
ncbi:DUF2868 domain-containing protein [Geoalkalibacter sp.]|uniref:DUF2868 domain-containing protein n=1 Tax=Geoalkalibacter sp. TaxID=3041440 RepID=UPI00272E7C96|nr:DUF2868 domain-containing protein [Geoalkalibacter sp.]